MLGFVSAPIRDVDISRETWEEEVDDDEMEVTITIYGESSIREALDLLDRYLIPYRRQ